MTFDDDGGFAAPVDARPITGAGGGGGGKGGSAQAAPDTLFSTATVRLVDLIGEGEIVGVRGGLKGVYLNDVPVQNADGTFNFKGLTAEFRVGTPDQSYMAGYPDVQTPQNVSIKVKQATPVSTAISDTDVDRVRVTLQFPALFRAKDDGSVVATTVQYRVETHYSGGPWVNQLGDKSLTGKTTSGYFRDHELTLPRNSAGASAPWQIRVTRLTADTDDFNNSQTKYTYQSDIIFYSVTSITDAKFAYPDSAVVGLTAQASSFGSSVPSRTYLVDGIIMPVPANYDPVARTYTGIWDGTFKQAFSNNPAWALYLILSNDRFGLGEFVDLSAIDKWSLYEIARYCDQDVPDGKGGTEPRFTFNGVISTQQDAFELLQLVAQIFRGLVYWSSGTVTATQDRPADPILLVTEANVIDGEISYASSGRRARHTVAIVAWNDPENLYKQAFEVVEDAEGVARYGYNPTKVDLLGCASRGQAHRAGLWTLFTELRQTQVATYKAGLDHAVARPGDIVAIQDPQIANIDLSGRLLEGSSANSLRLDRAITLTAGSPYTVSVTLPDGTVEEKAVASSASGTLSVLPLAEALSQTPDKAAVWLVAGPIAPQLFRIVSIREEQPHIYAVTALQHEPGKFDTIDTGAAFEPTVFSEFPTVVLPPTNLSVRESQYTELGQPRQALTLSWTPGQAFNSVAYYVTAIRPSGAILNLPKTASLSVDIIDVDPGEWTFVVTAIGLDGKPSLPAQLTYTVLGWQASPPTKVINLSVQGGGTIFGGRSCGMRWDNQIDPETSPYRVQNHVYVYDISTNALLHTELLPVGQTTWTYAYDVNVNEGGPRRQFRVEVNALSPDGTEGPPTSVAVSNPAPAAVVPSLAATSETVFVTLPDVQDIDFAGFLVWISPTSGFTPTDANSTDIGATTLQTFKGATNTTYYVRVAAYDAFSKAAAGLNISQEYSVTCSATAFDVTDPGIPQGLTLASNVVDVAPDGTVTGKVTLTWTALGSSNLGKYEVAFALGNNPADSAYVGGSFTTGATITKQGLVPGLVYSAKVRSISQNGFGISGWSSVLTFTAAANTTAPAPVSNLTVSAAVKNAFVSWTNPATADLAYVEVYAGATNAFGAATKIATVAAPASNFIDPSLPDAAARYYWARSFNSSGVGSTTTVGPVSAVAAALNGSLIAANTVAADRLLAGTITAREIATNTITADRLTADVLTANNIKVGNGSLGTLIAGTNSTTIDGGAISANSINANKLRVGSRGIQVAGCEFQWNRNPSTGAYTNVLSWTEGYVFYNDDNNNVQAPYIAAGSVTYVGQIVYVYWNKTNPGVFSARSDGNWVAINSDPNNVMMCLGYSVGSLAVVYGASIIDGTKITALSIQAINIAAAAISGDKIAANTITGSNIVGNTITGDKLQANSITAKHIVLTDASNMITNGDFGGPGGNGNADGWTFLAGDVVIDNPGTGDPGGSHRLRSASRDAAISNYITCTPGDVIYVSAMNFNVTPYTANIYWLGEDTSGTYVTGGSIVAKAPNTGWGRMEGQFTVPNGISRFRLDLQSERSGTGDGSLVYWGKIQARRAAGASLIVNGSITAEKLTIGTSTGNLLSNSDLMAGGNNWYGVNGTVSWSGPGSVYAPPSMCYIYNNSASGLGGYSWLKYYNQRTDGNWDFAIPVLPNTRYEASAYYSSGGGPGYVQLDFYDANNNGISSITSPDVVSNTSGRSLINWARAAVFFTTPPNCCSVQLSLVTYHNNQANSQDAWTGMYLGKALPNQTVFSDWVTNGATVINGGQISAASIAADRLSVGSLSAISANIGFCTAGIIQSSDSKFVINLNGRYLAIYD
ncbi:TipJ family phage tail tip protein [Methylobacterium gnaphalii]|uniref:Fibronectin type-III domain-containing protein n=1 Tax=Methylobacterium gnaphalii TaxID=1010610 RepID=A0A512JMH8_9HYPH|nr:phage tail protein [Methylobacterium gnaphalii]GEP11112.1 hypothetical protein MGN01_29570 [Methylobacterium gnaphalii]GJD69902.1 hypothetical protein MMMDOFMJ_2841 [Methylobacterium gnaphalii]GLS50390.1 hypothetical protein GCM10007885_32420 [Methylobacterium gnaphalii]